MMRIRYTREVTIPEAAAGMPNEVRDIEDSYGLQLVQDGYAVALTLPAIVVKHHGLPVVPESELVEEKHEPARSDLGGRRPKAAPG